MNSQDATLAEMALRTAVFADPEDDLPRRAYADWCEETGNQPRADFIRAELATDHQLAAALLTPQRFAEWFGLDVAENGRPAWPGATYDIRVMPANQTEGGGVAVDVLCRPGYWGELARDSRRKLYRVYLRRGWVDELWCWPEGTLHNALVRRHPLTVYRPVINYVWSDRQRGYVFDLLWRNTRLKHVVTLDLCKLLVSEAYYHEFLSMGVHIWERAKTSVIWPRLRQVIVPAYHVGRPRLEVVSDAYSWQRAVGDRVEVVRRLDGLPTGWEGEMTQT